VGSGERRVRSAVTKHGESLLPDPSKVAKKGHSYRKTTTYYFRQKELSLSDEDQHQIISCIDNHSIQEI